MCHRKQERQRIKTYLGFSRLEQVLCLLCECILGALLILTGLVEGLFGWLNYIPNERKVQLKERVLYWLECIANRVKKFQHYFHKTPPPM